MNSWKHWFPRRDLQLEKKVSLENLPKCPSSCLYLRWCTLVLTLFDRPSSLLVLILVYVVESMVRWAALSPIPNNLARYLASHLLDQDELLMEDIIVSRVAIFPRISIPETMW